MCSRLARLVCGKHEPSMLMSHVLIRGCAVPDPLSIIFDSYVTCDGACFRVLVYNVRVGCPGAVGV